jgi:hypothetical protein
MSDEEDKKYIEYNYNGYLRKGQVTINLAITPLYFIPSLLSSVFIVTSFVPQLKDVNINEKIMSFICKHILSDEALKKSCTWIADNSNIVGGIASVLTSTLFLFAASFAVSSPYLQGQLNSYNTRKHLQNDLKEGLITQSDINCIDNKYNESQYINLTGAFYFKREKNKNNEIDLNI